MSLRVFGILPRGARIPVPRLRAVRAGSVVAAVADAAGPRIASPANLRMHDRIVRELAAAAPAILPARFNTLVRDEDELRSVLRGRDAVLRSTLAKVRGRVQMTSRIVVTPTMSEKRTGKRGKRESRSKQAGPGFAYLREKAAWQRPPELDPLRAAVRVWVRDEHIERRGNVVTVYHLIPTRSVAAYTRAAARLAARTSGPFPPYAFAEPWS